MILPVRSVLELAAALRSRASYLTGQAWEVPATVAMMREAADRLEELERKIYPTNQQTDKPTKDGIE